MARGLGKIIAAQGLGARSEFAVMTWHHPHYPQQMVSEKQRLREGPRKVI